MASLVRAIKNVLNSKTTPEFLFSYYFNWKNKKDKEQLFGVLNKGEDLMNQLSSGGKQHWSERIQNVLDDPNNQFIPRHENAGQINDELLVMHNGIKVDPLSYYSYPMLKMLMDNKGVHEPQEEKIFQEVLSAMSGDSPKVMLELGAYWSFYSMWFKTHFPTAECTMVEPDRRNLVYGKRNFRINNFKGNFIHAGISGEKNKKQNITTVDAICEEQGIEFLDILHSDIQGYELEMLKGSKKMLSENRIGYAFVSTHSNDLHQSCKAFLEDKYNFKVIASANLDESFSWDGILVMKAPDYPGLDQVDIAKRIKQST